MRRSFKACGSIGPLFMLLALSGSAMAATYTGIDCPDSSLTQARAINDRGDIVGICEDANGTHGYRLRKGEFLLIDFPGAGATFATGTNNLGHVVGWYIGDDANHGYLLRNGRFTTIDPPGSVDTLAQGIDDLGRIVGFYLTRRRIPGIHSRFARLPRHYGPRGRNHGRLCNQRPGSNRRRLRRCRRHFARVLSQERQIHDHSSA